MPLRFLADKCLDGNILRGLQRRCPSIDMVRVQDVGLGTAKDDVILAHAASENRIVLTHDRNTMIGFAYQRITTGLSMMGLFVADDSLAKIGRIIEDLVILDACSETAEWQNQVVHLPL